MPSGPKKRRAAAKKKKALENLNTNHANNFQEINTNPDSTSAVNENTAVVIFSAIPTADSSDHSPKEDVPRDELNEGVKLVMKENDTASFVPAAFSVDLPDAAGDLPKDGLSFIDKDMIADAIALVDCIPEGTVESNEDFKQDLKENDMKFEFAENLLKEAIHVEFNDDSNLGFRPNDSTILPSVDDQISLTSTVALSTDADLNLTMEKVANLVPENPDENSKFPLPMDPSVEEDCEKAFESPNEFDIFNQNYTSEHQLEGTVESNEDFKQDLKENDMKFEFAENLPKEAIHVEFNEDSKLGFKPNDSSMLPSVDDQIPLTSAVALPTDTGLNLTMEKVANLVPENPDENSKFPLPMDPSVEEDCEKAFESPNDFDIFTQNYTSEHQLEGIVESNEDFKQDLKENDMKFEFAENLPKEAIHVEFNEDSKLGFKPNDSSMLPSVDDQIPLTSTVALPTDTDLNLTMEKVATLVPENPDESSKFTLPMDPSVEEDYEKAFESPNDFDIFNQNYTSEYQLEGTVESNEDFKQDLKENDMKFEFAENLPKEAIHVEFNEDSKLGFKPNDSSMLPSVDDQIPLTSTVALPTDTDLNLTMEKVATLVPENPDESSKFTLPMDPSVEEDYEKAFESPNDFDIFNQNYTSEYQLEGTVESNEDFKQDLKENDMKFEFAENLPKEGIHVEFNEDSNLGFKPNDSTTLQSVDDQIPLTATVALPTDTDLNLTVEKVVNLVPENPNKSSKFPLPMDPSVEEDDEKAFESPNDFDIFNQNYTSELQLQHFKKKVIDELKATDKMRAFLQKVLDDLNLMQLSGSGTSFF